MPSVPPNYSAFFNAPFNTPQLFSARTHFETFSYVYDVEPPGWPLTRPASALEWSHVLRVMLVRRVPLHGPIHRLKLINFVAADLVAASKAGRIYVDNYFTQMKPINVELSQLIDRADVLRHAPVMHDPDMPYPAQAIYRTDRTNTWLGHVPKVVKAVVDYLPTTSALDLLVQALIDAPPDDERTVSSSD